MSTTLTPPEPAGTAQGTPAGLTQPSPRRPSRTVAIVLAVIGAVVVLGTIVSTVVTTVLAARVEDRSFAVDAGTASNLTVDASGARVTIQFADVDEVGLDVTGARTGWSLERDGDDIVVRSDRGPFGWWFGGLLGQDTRATVLLPSDLEERLDAEVTLNGGELRATGGFRDLSVDASGGVVSLAGSARQLDLDMNAGRADVDLGDVGVIDLDISAGGLYARFDGTPPRSVAISASAGTGEVALPDAAYDVRAQVDAGRLDNRLTSSTNGTVVTVDLSAGNLTLVPLR